jgi:hypothetical protein
MGKKFMEFFSRQKVSEFFDKKNMLTFFLGNYFRIFSGEILDICFGQFLGKKVMNFFLRK